MTRDHPAYPFMRDGDGDGVVCESGSRRASPASSPASPRASGAGCGPYRNCTALRRDHPNGVPRGHCAYQRRMDRDNDGPERKRRNMPTLLRRPVERRRPAAGGPYRRAGGGVVLLAGGGVRLRRQSLVQRCMDSEAAVARAIPPHKAQLQRRQRGDEVIQYHGADSRSDLALQG